MNLLQLARALKDAGADIEERRNIIENEDYYDEDSLYESYDDALDSEGYVYIGSLQFLPSDVLKQCDPIAYKCGFNDFTSAFTEFDIDGERHYTEAIS